MIWHFWGKCSITLPLPCDLGKCRQLCSSHPIGMTAGPQPPAPGARAGAQAHSCSGFRFYGSPLAALLCCQTLPPRAGGWAASQHSGCQSRLCMEGPGASMCIIFPAAGWGVKWPWRLRNLLCTQNNFFQYHSCVTAMLGVIKPEGAKTPLHQAPCHHGSHANMDTPALQQGGSPVPDYSHVSSSPDGTLSVLCCKSRRPS